MIQFIFYLRKLVQKDCSSLCKALWDRDAAVSKEEIRCCFPPLRHQSAERERDEWASEGRRRGAITGLTEGAESRNNNHTSSPKRNRGGYSEAACHTKKANKASNHPAAADHTQMSFSKPGKIISKSNIPNLLINQKRCIVTMRSRLDYDQYIIWLTVNYRS